MQVVQPLGQKENFLSNNETIKTKKCPESSKIMALWDYKNNDPRLQLQKKHIEQCKSCAREFALLNEKNLIVKNSIPKPQIDTLSKETIKSEIEELFKNLQVENLKVENDNFILRHRDNFRKYSYSFLMKLPWMFFLGVCGYLIARKIS